MLVYRGVSFPVEIRIKSGSARKIEAKAAAEGKSLNGFYYMQRLRGRIEAKAAESGIVFYRGGQHRSSYGHEFFRFFEGEDRAGGWHGIEEFAHAVP